MSPKTSNTWDFGASCGKVFNLQPVENTWIIATGSLVTFFTENIYYTFKFSLDWNSAINSAPKVYHEPTSNLLYCMNAKVRNKDW